MGAVDGGRTRDLSLFRRALYRLSYGGMHEIAAPGWPCSGGGVRTRGLLVMSQASYRLLYSASFTSRRVSCPGGVVRDPGVEPGASVVSGRRSASELAARGADDGPRTRCHLGGSQVLVLMSFIRDGQPPGNRRRLAT